MPKIVDHDKMRAKLLEGCIELFARHGYASLSMRHIARELEVSTGTLYHYFPSKESLFEGVVDLVVDREMEMGRTLFPMIPEPVMRFDALMAYVEAQENHIVAELLVCIDYLRDRGPEEIAHDDHWVRTMERYHDMLAEQLELDNEQARFLSVCLDGLILRRIYDGRTTPITPIAARLRALLFPDAR